MMRRRMIIGNKAFGFYLNKAREWLRTVDEVEMIAASGNIRKMVDLIEVLKREGVECEKMWTETREIEIGKVTILVARIRRRV